MNKQEILLQFSKEDDKLFVSKMIDKYQYSISKNKITSTCFMNLAQKELAKKILASQKIKNYLFFGGFENCERCILIFYPQKFDLSIVQLNFSSLLGLIRIELPKELYSVYKHRDYLGGIVKMGINRDKIGDILVFENGADIVVSNDIINYLYTNISTLTRFSKSKIEKLDIQNIRKTEIKKEEIQIVIPSLRLDSIVAELCHTSRTNACKIIESEKVFVNFVPVLKTNFFLKENDILTIRKYGKYNILQLLGTTKKGNMILALEKYI